MTTAKKPVYLFGGEPNSWAHRRAGFNLTVADLTAAIASHGGNQTHFAKEIMRCTDGRQVRRWLAGRPMQWEAAKRLRDYLESSRGGTGNLFKQGRAK
jgi:hypothetical protein